MGILFLKVEEYANISHETLKNHKQDLFNAYYYALRAVNSTPAVKQVSKQLENECATKQLHNNYRYVFKEVPSRCV